MLLLPGSMFQQGQDSSFCANLPPPRQTELSSEVTRTHRKRFLVLLCSYSPCLTTRAYLSVQFPCSCDMNCLEIMSSHFTSLQINSSLLFLLGLQAAQLCDSVGIIQPLQKWLSALSPRLWSSRCGSAGTSVLTGSLCVLHPWLWQFQQSVKGEGLLLQSYL